MNRATPRFSFVIPFFDCQRHLARAVRSVQAQPGDDYELILVDDGSGDHSVALARQLAAQSPVTLVRQPNRGPGAARNRGAREARGDYLWFLDCDDELLSDALPRVRNALQAHPEVALVAGGHLTCSSSGRERLHQPAPLQADPLDNARRFLRKRLGSFSHGALIFQRRLFQHSGYPEQLRNNEDLVFLAEVLARHPCLRLSEPLVRVHTRPDSLRHQLPATDPSDTLTALLFDQGRLPPELASLRSAFLVGRRLSRFRALYRAGRGAEARRLYHRTVRDHPAALLHWSYLSKYLRLLVHRHGSH